MDEHVATVARQQHGLITLAQLDEIGITRRQRQWRFITERQGLPDEVQFVVRDTDGRVVARCDLAYPQWRIVIGYDSVQEHTGRGALLRDSARRNAIAALGFTPVVATVDDVHNQAVRLASVIRQIRDRAA